MRPVPVCLGVVAIAGGVAFLPNAGASISSPAVSLSPAGNLHNGESISVSVGANSLFTPNAHVNILECADPGGTAANLPKDVSTCDGNTIQGNTVLIAANGSLTETAYTLYVLPSSTLGEPAHNQPVCNTSNPCVLYVGQNQEDFTAPKVFSAPFSLSPSSATTSTTPATVRSTATTATTTAPTAGSTVPETSPSVATAPASADPAVSLTSSATPSTLAETGAPTATIWLVLFGAALFVIGAVGRRRTTVAQP
jgi:LPXTG-motif cell wall-anchored protein